MPTPEVPAGARPEIKGVQAGKTVVTITGAMAASTTSPNVEIQRKGG